MRKKINFNEEKDSCCLSPCVMGDRGLNPFNSKHWKLCLSVSVHVEAQTLVPSMVNIKIVILYQEVIQIISCLLPCTQ